MVFKLYMYSVVSQSHSVLEHRITFVLRQCYRGIGGLWVGNRHTSYTGATTATGFSAAGPQSNLITARLFTFCTLFIRNFLHYVYLNLLTITISIFRINFRSPRVSSKYKINKHTRSRIPVVYSLQSERESFNPFPEFQIRKVPVVCKNESYLSI